jgi:anti-sigma-K factor RskA
MNDERFDELMAEARAHEINVSRVALGLETRVVARVMEGARAEEALGQWTLRIVWRSATVAVVLTAGLLAWGFMEDALDPAAADAMVLRAVEDPVSLGGVPIF